ncbi:hypothetical protein GQ607_009867 [Colletotrichum asianum]|uniref:Uncharacterized protein n=1 Tax=Colletotrichum asianum TaxID=702518 RepID=A0A8H3ZPE4_9PEZI|nr:hypothetical protein GQ607_009867 [Colletotrichum asianum]
MLLAAGCYLSYFTRSTCCRGTLHALQLPVGHSVHLPKSPTVACAPAFPLATRTCASLPYLPAHLHPLLHHRCHPCPYSTHPYPFPSLLSTLEAPPNPFLSFLSPVSPAPGLSILSRPSHPPTVRPTASVFLFLFAAFLEPSSID